MKDDIFNIRIEGGVDFEEVYHSRLACNDHPCICIRGVNLDVDRCNAIQRELAKRSNEPLEMGGIQYDSHNQPLCPMHGTYYEADLEENLWEIRKAKYQTPTLTAEEKIEKAIEELRRDYGGRVQSVHIDKALEILEGKK